MSTANDYIRELQKERIRTHENKNYKFSEAEILFDVKSYIDDTYSSHYAKEPKQATELIIENGHGEGFCIGNILKYAQRYGKKDGHNKNDLMKVIHYAIINYHRTTTNDNTSICNRYFCSYRTIK